MYHPKLFHTKSSVFEGFERGVGCSGERGESMTTSGGAGSGPVVWKGRPSVGPYVALYGALAAVVTVVLLALEFILSGYHGLSLLDRSVTLAGITVPYALEVATVTLVLLWYLAKLVGLALLRARNSYELRSDGLQVNRGIARLENTFVSPMAFSDARLIRTIGMRLVGRSLIIVDTNDNRHFELRMVKDGMKVQAMIRDSLGHPTVRLDPRSNVAPTSP